MGRTVPSRRWPSTEKEWFRFRERYNPVIARIARAHGINDLDDVEDMQAQVWYVILVKGFMEKYDPSRGPLEGFLVALAKTICFFEGIHERRRRERLVMGQEDDEDDGADELRSVEFWMLYEQADAAVMRRRVNTTSGPALLRRVWAGIKNDETRADIAAAAGVSEQYIALMVGELREIPEVRALVGVTG